MKSEVIVAIINIIVVVIIGGFTYHNSIKLLEFEEKNHKSNMAQTELYIQELILNARKVFIDITIEQLKIEVDPNNSKAKEFSHTLFRSGVQEILNSYEVACSKYIDNKIDKDRFKKTYIKEIRDLFDSKSPYLNELNKQNSYHAIKKVNEEWNNLEKN